MTEQFHGVKVALLHDDQVLIYLRDSTPGLRFAGLWDLPGGGREGNESPEETAVREIQEEFGITISYDQLIFKKTYPSMHLESVTTRFFVGTITTQQIASIRFGSEGQRYMMLGIDEYLALQDAVAPLQDRLRDYISTVTPVKS